ncbi:MAG: hypothetical protein PHP45_05435, partial [Elusimicrobiales bacterium]|nr:hypothetical protein [Elusimicrobiales bacterium]
GSLLAVLTQTGTLSLWTTGRGRLLALAAHPAGGKCVAVSPNAKYALSGGLENSLKIWRISDGAAVRSFDTGDEVSACAWTPAGDFVAAAGPSGRIKIFSIQDGAKTQEFAGRRGEVFSAAFSRDGRLLASAGEDGAVRVWKLQYPAGAPPQAFVSPDAARASTIAVAASTQTVQERRYGEPPPSAESQLRQFIAGHPAAAAGAGAVLLALLLFPALAKRIGSRLKTAPSNAQADNPAYTVRTQMKMDDVHNRQEEAKRALAGDRAGSALPESSWLAHYDPKNADKRDSGKNDK